MVACIIGVKCTQSTLELTKFRCDKVLCSYIKYYNYHLLKCLCVFL